MTAVSNRTPAPRRASRSRATRSTCAVNGIPSMSAPIRAAVRSVAAGVADAYAGRLTPHTQAERTPRAGCQRVQERGVQEESGSPSGSDPSFGFGGHAHGRARRRRRRRGLGASGVGDLRAAPAAGGEVAGAVRGPRVGAAELAGDRPVVDLPPVVRLGGVGDDGAGAAAAGDGEAWRPACAFAAYRTAGPGAAHRRRAFLSAR